MWWGTLEWLFRSCSASVSCHEDTETSESDDELPEAAQQVLAKLHYGDVLDTQKPRRPWTHFALVEFVAAGKLNVIECTSDEPAIKRDHFKLRWTSEGFTDEAGSKVVFWKSPSTLESGAAEKAMAGIFEKHHEWSLCALKHTIYGDVLESESWICTTPIVAFYEGLGYRHDADVLPYSLVTWLEESGFEREG